MSLKQSKNWLEIERYLREGKRIKKLPSKRIKQSYSYQTKNSKSFCVNFKRVNECGVRYTTKRIMYANANNIMNL